MSAEHVDALAAATRGLDEDAAAALAGHQNSLLAQAQHDSVETFARECRELARNLSADEGESELDRQRKQNSVRQWVDKVTGMHHIHAELDPESGAKAWTAINAVTRAMRHAEHTQAHAEAHPDPGPDPDPEAAGRADDARPPAPPSPAPDCEARPWDWWAAQALVELLTGARSVDKRVPEIAIHIDWPTLLNGLHESSLCETADGTLLPPSTVRRADVPHLRPPRLPRAVRAV